MLFQSDSVFRWFYQKLREKESNSQNRINICSWSLSPRSLLRSALNVVFFFLQGSTGIYLETFSFRSILSKWQKKEQWKAFTLLGEGPDRHLCSMQGEEHSGKARLKLNILQSLLNVPRKKSSGVTRTCTSSILDWNLLKLLHWWKGI